CLLADKGKSDIRLEAALGKLWNTDVAWGLCDDAMQIRGGRGYETAPSLASRGEAPIPLERAMRDLRINRIFEGSNQVMRLFIAREALDVHLQVAGDVVMPGVPLPKRLSGLVRSGLFYAGWYPTRWLGWGHWPQYGEFGPLAGHLRWIERTSRRLARQMFHLMVLNGPALEKKQGLLFRAVDVGAELFAMAATIVRAQRDVKAGIGGRTSYELADTFCRASRCARTMVAVMANNSAPTSTARNNSPCFFSSAGPFNTMRWNNCRANRRELRSTHCRCPASGPNSPYCGQCPQPSQRLGYQSA
ncbi:MAG: acyl-CoA dehydrogenase family protein, partial [bacterium]